MDNVQIKCINVALKQSDLIEIKHSYEQAFDRFNHFIRQVQITYRDVNGPKGGIDKLCIMQMSFQPRGLEVVKCIGTSFPHVTKIAYEKMKQVIAKRIRKRRSVANKNLTNRFDGGQNYVD